MKRVPSTQQKRMDRFTLYVCLLSVTYMSMHIIAWVITN